MGDIGSEMSNNNPSPIIVSGKIMLASMIFLFFVVLFILYLHIYYNRRNRFIFSQNNHPGQMIRATENRGLKDSILQSLPITVFEDDKSKTSSVECAVCISEFSEGEKLRVLPTCMHGFHLECIDMWFHSHSTCPLCRKPVSLEPLQQTTKQIEADLDMSNHLNVIDRDVELNVNIGVSTSVGHSDTSISSASSRENNGILVIEIPQGTQSGIDEQMKSPMMKRFASFKRLLSLGMRSPSSPCTAPDIEKGEGSEEELHKCNSPYSPGSNT